MSAPNSWDGVHAAPHPSAASGRPQGKSAQAPLFWDRLCSDDMNLLLSQRQERVGTGVRLFLTLMILNSPGLTARRATRSEKELRIEVEESELACVPANACRLLRLWLFAAMSRFRRSRCASVASRKARRRLSSARADGRWLEAGARWVAGPTPLDLTQITDLQIPRAHERAATRCSTISAFPTPTPTSRAWNPIARRGEPCSGAPIAEVRHVGEAEGLREQRAQQIQARIWVTGPLK
jgi:hypothetical protein